MAVTVPSFKLNTGASIPAIGLGTWQSKPEEVTAAVEHALKIGYRHLDCAWMYGNEAAVGEGIRRSGVPRSEIFVTSKLWSTKHSRVAQALQESLDSLGLDGLALFLIHWAVALNHPDFPARPSGSLDVHVGWTLADAWRHFEAVYREGKDDTSDAQRAVRLVLADGTQLLPTSADGDAPRRASTPPVIDPATASAEALPGRDTQRARALSTRHRPRRGYACR